jgi:ankyrin repeat protein
MIAARTGNVEAIKTLLDNGADINAKDTQRGTTALMWAADEGHAAAVKLLIDRGADITAKSNPAPRGRGPALGKANDPRKAVAAQGAALAAGNPVSQILRDDGTANNAGRGGRNGGRGANAGGGGRGAGRADRCGRRRPAGRCRGSVWIRSRQTGSERRRCPDSAHLRDAAPTTLSPSRCCSPRAPTFNQTSNYGWSPLLVATQNRYYKLGAYLIERGADPNLANKGGWVRFTSRRTTATSRAATTRSGAVTWTTSSSSSCCSTRAPTSMRA